MGGLLLDDLRGMGIVEADAVELEWLREHGFELFWMD